MPTTTKNDVVLKMSLNTCCVLKTLLRVSKILRHINSFNLHTINEIGTTVLISRTTKVQRS